MKTTIWGPLAVLLVSSAVLACTARTDPGPIHFATPTPTPYPVGAEPCLCTEVSPACCNAAEAPDEVAAARAATAKALTGIGWHDGYKGDFLEDGMTGWFDVTTDAPYHQSGEHAAWVIGQAAVWDDAGEDKGAAALSATGHVAALNCTGPQRLPGLSKSFRACDIEVWFDVGSDGESKGCKLCKELDCPNESCSGCPGCWKAGGKLPCPHECKGDCDPFSACSVCCHNEELVEMIRAGAAGDDAPRDCSLCRDNGCSVAAWCDECDGCKSAYAGSANGCCAYVRANLVTELQTWQSRWEFYDVSDAIGKVQADDLPGAITSLEGVVHANWGTGDEGLKACQANGACDDLTTRVMPDILKASENECRPSPVNADAPPPKS